MIVHASRARMRGGSHRQKGPLVWQTVEHKSAGTEARSSARVAVNAPGICTLRVVAAGMLQAQLAGGAVPGPALRGPAALRQLLLLAVGAAWPTARCRAARTERARPRCIWSLGLQGAYL